VLFDADGVHRGGNAREGHRPVPGHTTLITRETVGSVHASQFSGTKTHA
jgi:hypothetical protein